MAASARAAAEQLDARIVETHQQQECGDQRISDDRHSRDLRGVYASARKGVEAPAAVPDDRVSNDGGDDGEFGSIERADEWLVVRVQRNWQDDAEQEAKDGVNPGFDEPLGRRPHARRADRHLFVG